MCVQPPLGMFQPHVGISHSRSQRLQTLLKAGQEVCRKLCRCKAPRSRQRAVGVRGSRVQQPISYSRTGSSVSGVFPEEKGRGRRGMAGVKHTAGCGISLSQCRVCSLCCVVCCICCLICSMCSKCRVRRM